jgi:ADP-heptose:LPS heptosyltransferase
MNSNSEAPAAGKDLLNAKSISLYRLSKTLGDTLFLSTVAREIRKRRPECEVHIQSHWPALFFNNPDVKSSRPIFEPKVPEGIHVRYEDHWPPPRRQHILQTICYHLGLNGAEVQPITYYFPTEEERRYAETLCPKNGRPLVVIHPFSGFFAPRTKQWSFSNWKRLLEIIPEDIETLRFVNPDEPATPSERPFHRDIQTTEIRIMASLLERADAFLGHESGLAHLATALGIPAVVIFTGYVPPEVFGYRQNINLVPDLPYIPCWQGDGCEPCHGEICTKAVSPERAREALLEILARRRR